MSVRIFPPSDEKHGDFEFDLDEFMGKWLVSISFNIGSFLITRQVCHPFNFATLEGKCGHFPA